MTRRDKPREVYLPDDDERFRDSECARKTAYETPSAASTSLTYYIPERDQKGMTIYKCPHCSNWHIGHTFRTKHLIKKTPKEVGEGQLALFLVGMNGELIVRVLS